MKIGRSEEKNCQEDLWQENCLNSQTNGTTKNIGEDWKEIRDSGKENDQGKEKSGVREQTEEDNDEIGNMVDLYYKLQGNSLGQGSLKGGSVMTWQNS